jgi:hypothetical protein
LAQNPGRVVDKEMLMTPEKHALKSRRNRLANLLRKNAKLNQRIKAEPKSGYFLDVDRDDVTQLHDTGDRLVFEGQSRNVAL